MRLAFLGTPEAAVVSLRALVSAGHDVDRVITRPDRRRGRGGALVASPVKAAALELGLEVGSGLADLEGSTAELGVVVAYGALIPATVLARLPMLNVHFSLLPRWRGAAPVERAILAGDEMTGVSIMSLEAGLDTGPVHLTQRVAVDDKTLAALTGELAEVGARALCEVLASPTLLANAQPQTGEITYAEKLQASSFHLEPRMTTTEARRVVRLGRAFVLVAGRRVAILEAHVASGSSLSLGRVVVTEGVVGLTLADGVLALDEVRPEGSRAMTASAWWAGARLDPGVAWS